MSKGIEVSVITEAALEMIKEKAQNEACKRGIRPVQKAVMDGEKGLVVLAADATPLDLVSHLPAMCNEKEVPLVFMKSRFDILTELKKPHTCLLIPEGLLEPEELKLIFNGEYKRSY